MTEQLVYPLLLMLASLDSPAQAEPRAPVQAQTQQQIPRAYQGEWNMRVKDCGTSRNDSTLRLRPDSIAYFESTGPVKTAVTRGKELVLVAELQGEGETRLHAAHFRLSRNGRTLTDVTSTPPLVRYRCPARRN